MTAKFPLIPYQEVHHFRKTFISLMYSSKVTRQQVIYLSMLIANGLTENFRAKEVELLGIEYNLGRKYLQSLYNVGFAKKNGILWSITPAGIKYYEDFAREFQVKVGGKFRWR